MAGEGAGHQKYPFSVPELLEGSFWVVVVVYALALAWSFRREILAWLW